MIALYEHLMFSVIFRFERNSYKFITIPHIFILANTKVRDGDQPPMVFDLSASESAASRMTIFPTSVDPVRLTFLTLGCLTRARME